MSLPSQYRVCMNGVWYSIHITSHVILVVGRVRETLQLLIQAAFGNFMLNLISTIVTLSSTIYRTYPLTVVGRINNIKYEQDHLEVIIYFLFKQICLSTYVPKRSRGASDRSSCQCHLSKSNWNWQAVMLSFWERKRYDKRNWELTHSAEDAFLFRCF